MTELGSILTAFQTATGCQAAVWIRPESAATARPTSAEFSNGQSTLVALHATPAGGWCPPPSDSIRRIQAPPGRQGEGGALLIAPIPRPREHWLTVGPCSDRTRELEPYLAFLLPVVGHYLRASIELEHATNELVERYEEINLLYTITEMLGRTVSLQEASASILREISETVGARRGAILVHDHAADTLQPIAVLGVAVTDVPHISIDDDCSVSARVFRDRYATIAEDGTDGCEAENPYRRGAMLSVPIMWTAPARDAEPLGVLNLTDRRGGQPFTAGDRKLVNAIVTQIGTAIQNARLVRESLSQQRLMRELELAHDLQMKLLPRVESVAPDAHVAARVIPAESVGGDFYNLFHLGPGRTGVMVGDVSSHGYPAALIMALAMSASAIHAQSLPDPSAVLAALLESLKDELTSTEMFITAFYGVIDRDAGTLRFANAGHPHAYHITEHGAAHRLGASDPPLGMVDSPPGAVTRSWSHRDLLLLFTDGVSDALDHAGARMGEARVVETVKRHRADSPAKILERVFDDLHAYTGGVPQSDDIAVIALRS